MSRFTVVALCALSLACPQPVPTPEEEACEHLELGPPVAVTAVASGDGPLLSDDHQRYDVALVAVTGGNGGRVRFSAAEAGEFLFLLDNDVPFAIERGGTPVTLEESAASSPDCAVARARHVADLSVGTYDLVLGPTTQTSVGIVVEHLLAH